MRSTYIVTFIANDRPGLVEALSAVIAQHEGNWHDSRLSQLGGKFAGLIQVSLPAERGEQLEQDLKALADRGVGVQVTQTGENSTIPGRDVELRVLGPDRPGIVREISSALAKRAINVLDLDSQVARAPMSAEAVFSARITARIPNEVDAEELAGALDDIANQMTLDIELD